MCTSVKFWKATRTLHTQGEGHKQYFNLYVPYVEPCSLTSAKNSTPMYMHFTFRTSSRYRYDVVKVQHMTAKILRAHRPPSAILPSVSDPLQECSAVHVSFRVYIIVRCVLNRSGQRHRLQRNANTHQLRTLHDGVAIVRQVRARRQSSRRTGA